MTETKQRKCICVLRIRGLISASREVRETLQKLHLTRNNYAVLVDDRPSFQGMLHTARSFITWGEISKETLNLLVKERGRLVGNKKLSDEYAKEVGFKSLDELIEAISNCQVEYWKLPNVQPVFKLHPPSKGFKGKIKKDFTMGGELGYRGEKINDLIKLMI